MKKWIQKRQGYTVDCRVIRNTSRYRTDPTKRSHLYTKVTREMKGRTDELRRENSSRTMNDLADKQGNHPSLRLTIRIFSFAKLDNDLRLTHGLFPRSPSASLVLRFSKDGHSFRFFLLKMENSLSYRRASVWYRLIDEWKTTRQVRSNITPVSPICSMISRR